MCTWKLSSKNGYQANDHREHGYDKTKHQTRRYRQICDSTLKFLKKCVKEDTRECKGGGRAFQGTCTKKRIDLSSNTQARKQV